MRLLIITQVVDQNDSDLGFFHRWIEEFAKHCEKVSVICLFEGAHTLPANVQIYSLGKEKYKGPSFIFLRRWEYAKRFWRLAAHLRLEYDTVFVHMNPEYVVLGTLLWKAWGKRVGLWYMHKSVTYSLRFAALFADVIFTASKESIRIRASHIQIMGHGIDVARFTAGHSPRVSEVRIVTLGRISRSKGLLDMLAALDVLHMRGVPFSFTIAGAPMTEEDKEYLREVQAAIARRPYAPRVGMHGPIRYDRVSEFLRDADVFLNLSRTGSLDKAGLEALIAGVPLVSSNQAFRPILPSQLFVSNTPEEIAEAIERAVDLDVSSLSRSVREQHSVEGLIAKIVARYEVQ